MIPAASPAGLAVKTAQPVAPSPAMRAAEAPGPEAARASAGESAPAQVTLLSAKAVTAPDQAAVAPRLRDQETTERTDRSATPKDSPTGPPPSFEESPLERQARVAFDPPAAEAPSPREAEPLAPVAQDDTNAPAEEAPEIVKAEAPPDPPPTPTERAEASFAETRTIANPKEPATVDLSQ